MRELAMFPLGNPLLPGMVLPLRLFEDRYLQMYADLIDTDREFGVVLIERGVESRDDSVKFDMGTLARVVGSGVNDDGTIGLVSIGVHRIAVAEWLPADPYPRALVADLADDPLSDAGMRSLASAETRIEELMELVTGLDPDVETEIPDLSDDPARRLYQLAQLAGLQAIDLQKLIEAETSDHRASLTDQLIAETTELIRLQTDIE